MLIEGANWSGNPSANSEAIDRLRKVAGVHLPEDYYRFLKFSDGGEGPLAIDPGYIVIDSAEDAASQKENKIFDEFFPGFFMFGGNGAGELFAFDVRDLKPWPIVMIDITNIDLAESVVRIANDFSDFLKHIGKE